MELKSKTNQELLGLLELKVNHATNYEFNLVLIELLSRIISKNNEDDKQLEDILLKSMGKGVIF